MNWTFAMTTALAGLLIGSAYWASRGGDPITEAKARSHDSKAIAVPSEPLRLAVPARDEIGGVLRNDAKFFDGFEVIAPFTIPARLGKDPKFDRSAWSNVGAQAVIKSTISGGLVRFQLYDLSKGDDPVLESEFPLSASRKAAHDFMNMVVDYFSGTPGVFGSRIAFVRTRRVPSVSKNILIADMDGGELAVLTSNRSLNILPSLGAGGRVIFTSYAKRNPDLWMRSGNALVQVSKRPGLNLGGAMSPNGEAIALTLSKDGNSEIYTITIDGSIKARLTKNDSMDGSASWSGGGDEIAFVSDRSGAPQIYRMSGGGGAAIRVSKEGDYNQEPDWRPGGEKDNKWVAYAGRSGERFDIFKVNVGDGRLKRITHDGGRNTHPTWAADGRLIAFSSVRRGIVIANQDGDNPISVVRAGTTPDWGPRPSSGEWAGRQSPR